MSGKVDLANDPMLANMGEEAKTRIIADMLAAKNVQITNVVDTSKNLEQNKAAAEEKKVETTDSGAKPNEEVEKNEGYKFDSPLLRMNIGGGENKNLIDENYEDLNFLVKKAQELGHKEIKEPKQLKEFFEKYQNLKQVEADFESTRTKADNFERIFSSLPPDVAEIVTTFLDARMGDTSANYRDVMKRIANSNLDFSKPVEQYRPLELVSMFNPMTEDEWEELTEAGKRSVLQSSTLAYNQQRENALNSQQRYLQNQEQREKNRRASIENSIAELRKANPYMNEKELNGIRDVMYKGKVSGEMFQDKTGFYKPEAAELVANSLYAKQTLESVMKEITSKQTKRANEVISKHNEETVLRGADYIPKGAGSGANDKQKTPEEIAKAMTPWTSRLKSGIEWVE